MIKNQVFPFIIGSSSCTNGCSLAMVDTLQLPKRKHPNAYKLSWLNEDVAVWLRKQALVNFKVGDYRDEIWCDALPVVACSLLLGRLCQSDRDILHNVNTNETYNVIEI